MFKTILLLVITHCLVRSFDIPEKVYYDLENSESLFQNFMTKYQKQYTSEEEKYRFRIFKDNLQSINQLNKEHENTVFGVTPFSDLTNEEFNSVVSCLEINSSSEVQPMESMHKNIELPKELDYRKQNLVARVKNQGSCGSCYIFSAVGEIEGQYAKKHKNLVILSEGYPLDCNDKFTCKGGDPVDVMNWLAGTPGELKLKDYPYSLVKTPCRADPKKGFVKVKGGKSFSTNTTDELKKKLVDHGPLTIALYANSKFQYYAGGVLDPDCTGYERLNHGVVLVGYGTDKEDHWLIKNSWSEEWGEKGYIRLAVTNKCGVGSYVVASEVE